MVSNGADKLTKWLLGFIAAALLTGLGAFLNQTANEGRALRDRLTVIELQHAALQETIRDTNRRLIDVEEQLRQLKENVRKLY